MGLASAFTAQRVPGTNTQFWLVAKARFSVWGEGGMALRACEVPASVAERTKGIVPAHPSTHPRIPRAPGPQDRADRRCPKRYLGVACSWGGPSRALLADAAAEHGGYGSGAVALFEQDTPWASTKWQLLRWGGLGRPLRLPLQRCCC